MDLLRVASRLSGVAAGLIALLFALPCAAQEAARSNVFGDPFVQATAALDLCPIPEGPGVTPQQAREEAHDRAQRGVSCWLAGRCRLPNAYLYDAEIVPRAQQAIRVDGRFGATTSIWLVGRRRHVWLQGCVSALAEAAALVELVRRLDDVEGVVDELMVGTAGAPAYRAAPR